MTMNKKLTATESKVLKLIAEQKKSKEIAEILFGYRINRLIEKT